MLEYYEQIISKLYTKEDVDLFDMEIDELLKGLYESGEGSFDNVLKEKVRVRIAEQLKDIIERSQVSKEECLKNLIKETEKIKVIKITVSFEPTYAAIIRISQWVKQNISNYTVLKTIYDREIVGGLIVEYEGNYRDYSLKKNFQAILEESESHIKEIVGI
jgi:F0F1-type ATP synthase delta subunit